MAMAMTNTFKLVNLIKLRLDVPYAEDCHWDADSEAEDGFTFNSMTITGRDIDINGQIGCDFLQRPEPGELCRQAIIVLQRS